ncbi:hypothetical protein TWF788_007936 [Orbilia oligospora]|uniref:Uncharacterized protein n=1 Tax=Orbilia oligospora TaxID=2813651 RepID=A0A6G1MCP4_ORBOL|nr:hypothetical protein TWF788_007936 [Orbilia oligospora]KAF3217119.1 hypothetical protein TWF191_008798 [Orbilia oligospora]KAF3222427.1 hypothetical protein TWF679_005907 [Orbilia oligospora]KAF3253548.1 hypothetical protein TWF192_003801 [Orbilia oligospora]
MSGGGPFFNQDKAKHSLEDLRSEVFNLSGISLSIEHEIQEAITCIIDEKLRPLIQEIAHIAQLRMATRLANNYLLHARYFLK